MWLGNSEIERLTVKSRRILFAHCVGEAFEKLKSDAKYDAFRYRRFEKTGCLITADGSEDEKIKLEALSDYIVPPPLPVEGPQQATASHSKPQQATASHSKPQQATACEVPEPAPSFEPEGTTRVEDDELEYETIANEEMETKIALMAKMTVIIHMQWSGGQFKHCTQVEYF